MAAVTQQLSLNEEKLSQQQKEIVQTNQQLSQPQVALINNEGVAVRSKLQLWLEENKLGTYSSQLHGEGVQDPTDLLVLKDEVCSQKKTRGI